MRTSGRITSVIWRGRASRRRPRRLSRAARLGRSKAERRDRAMRYVFLVYSRETEMAEASAEDIRKIRAGHWAVIDETKKRGVFLAGEPLRPTATATTIRREDGQPL